VRQYGEYLREVTTTTRETLYDEVWTQPMTTVAERYGVSSNYLARICEQLKVPRPGRGYWQQLAAGKLVERDPLPEPDPGDVTAWKRGSGGGYNVRPISTPTFTGLGERKTRRGERPKTHPLLAGVREDFLDSKPRRFDRHGYLVPKRGALPDIFVSKDALNGALDVANRLYLALEDRGHWVREAAVQGYRRPALGHEEHPKAKPSSHHQYDSSRIWSSARPTLVYIGNVAIGLVVFEVAEEVEVMYSDGDYVRVPQTKAMERLRATRSWGFSRHFLPSGRLGVQAYSPYSGAPWERYWRESKAGELKRLLDGIVSELEAVAPQLAAQAHESARKAKEEQRRRDAAERERRRKELEEVRAKAATTSRAQLLEVIERWVTACHIEKFFEDLAKPRSGLTEEEQATVTERIESARKLFGGAKAIDHFWDWKTPDEHFEAARRQLWWWRADEDRPV
jgi:hypothetical protein